MRISILMVMLQLGLGTGPIARAQMPAPPPGPEMPVRSSDDLDQMLGPIALYPDPLIAQILPAATLPAEIVLADRYVNDGGNPDLIDQQPWDSSVKALARYPAVLKWMDDNLDWTTTLGQTFLYQQQDVMDSVQRLRARAQSLGNLQSSPQENVYADAGTIEIVPADPQVIYVPVYQPEMVYYQRPFGSPFISFGFGLEVGGWFNHDFDWRNRRLIEWRRDQPRPADWWSHRPSERPRSESDRAIAWQPQHRQPQATSGLDRGWDSRPVRTTPARIDSQPRQQGRIPTPTQPARQPALPERLSAPAQSPRAPSPVERQPTPVQPFRQPTPVERQPTPAQPARQPLPVERQPSPAQPARPPAPVEPRQAPAQPVRRAEPVTQRPAPVAPSRPASGALIGVHSSQDTRQFSNRGQESRQVAPPRQTAPPARSAPPAAAPKRPSDPTKH